MRWPQNTIAELYCYEYFLTLEDNKIKYNYEGEGEPPEKAIKLLKEIAENKDIRDNIKQYLKRQFEPRPDLKDDSYLWKQLLKVAWRKNKKLHGTLHGVRCAGARLDYNEKLKLLAPDNMKKPEWQEIRKDWLLSDKEKITALFKESENKIKERAKKF